MKSRYILMSVAAAAMTFVSCVKENVVDQTFSEVTLNAVTETGQTKTALTGFADVVWAAGDKIAVYDGAAFTDFTLSSGAGTASAAFSGTLAEGKTAAAAVYPASAKGADMTTVKYPTEYAYSEMGVNAPMVASVVDGVLQFKHVGGVVKFDVGNIPPTAAGFVFTANSKITGDFTVTEGAVATTAGAAESVKITFTPASMKSAVFMVPLPTGTYTGFSVKFVDGSGVDIAGSAKVKDTYSFTIARKQLLAFPGFVDTTTLATKVLWEGNKTTGWGSGVDFVGQDLGIEAGNVLRVHYSGFANDEATSANFVLTTMLSDMSGWGENFHYADLTKDKSYYDVTLSQSMVDIINATGLIVRGGNVGYEMTKIELLTASVKPETVIWTGRQEPVAEWGYFGWLNGDGALPVELKAGDVICFYYETMPDAPYRVISLVDGTNAQENTRVVNYPQDGDTYTEIELTQEDLDKFEDTMRIGFNYIIVNKVTLK